VKVSPDFVRTEGGELSVEEMYKRTLQEVGSLREQLGRSGPVAPDNTP
jgi:hypothetical protein